MGPEHFGWGGMWIFPVMICIVMMIACFFFFSRCGFRPPWMHSSDRGQGGHTSSETPLDILKKRYASGEISKEEFEQMKKDI